MPMQGIPITATQAQTIGAWQQFATFGPTQPDNVVVDTSTGGSSTQNNDSITLTTDATAGEHAAAGIFSRANNLASGLLVGYFSFSTNQAIADLAENIEVGFLVNGTFKGRDSVGFVPSAGDSTDGNIFVDDNTTETTGSLNYPTVSNEQHYYAIVVNFDAAETKFFVDKNPLAAKEDAKIDAVPEQIRPAGGQIVSAQTDSNETLKMMYAGYVYIPQA